MAPVNVPTLRGIWATGPYLRDGSAKSLGAVLTANPQDVHGMRAGILSAEERQALVAYLLTL